MLTAAPPALRRLRDDLRLDLDVGLHAHQVQGLLHGFAEHRCRHIAAVDLAGLGVVDHHRDDDARLLDRRHADEEAAVFLLRIAPAFLLARGAGLAPHRVAHGLRLGRGAARPGRQLQHVTHGTRITRLDQAHAGHGALQLLQRHRDQLAVVRKHGVGMGQLHQTERTGHSRKLMVACSIGRQVFQGRRRPLTAPGKGNCGRWPKPTCAVHLPQVLGRHLHGHLGDADVAGLLDHLVDGQHGDTGACR